MSATVDLTLRRRVARAVVRERVDRSLAARGERLYTPRAGTAEAEFGPHCIIDSDLAVMRTHVSLEDLGRELGALKRGEILE